jgi:hypothetical protein
MEHYNRQLAHELRGNIERYLSTHPQAQALSSGYLYGGKRVREHPQAGFTAYSQDPGTLIPHNGNLMLHNFDDDENFTGGGRLTNAIKQRILETHPELHRIHLSGGKINWKSIWDGIKKGASVVSKVASNPLVQQYTPDEYKDILKKTGDISGAISGSGRLTKAIKQRILETHPELHRIHLSGGKINWKSIWDGIKKGANVVSKVASNPLVQQFTPDEYKDTLKKTGDISGAISGMGRVSGGVNGAGFWKDFGDGFVKGFKGSTKVASKVLPIMTAFAPEIAPLTGAVVAADKLINKGSGRRRGRPRKIGGDLYPPAVKGGMSNHRRKSVGHAKNQARGALIRQLMREKGLTLPQASSYIKQHNITF